MICRIKGRLEKKEPHRLIVDVGGLFYEIFVPKTVASRITHAEKEPIELITYHYFNIDKSRGMPVMVGFLEELEKDFFEQFISVSGIGPKAALRAFDRPIAIIAQAIEKGDVEFLQTLDGVGKQRAKQIVAHLQGKVGRFALIKESEAAPFPAPKEIVLEAKEVLKRLQYNSREAEDMIQKALAAGSRFERVEELLNEIYRQHK